MDARALGRGPIPRWLRAAAWGVAASCTACTPPAAVLLPAPSSPRPVPRPEGGLRAGFGRADITPAPGIGLAGNGPEGRRARGYRTRLYARALVLEDSTGERLAIVATDLGMVSAQLQRRAAAIVDSMRHHWLGADRLIVTATHTHSGPGNFFDAAAYNLIGSSVGGYDSAAAEWLAGRVAKALIAAIDSARPASAAWGWTRAWGFTRNRSYESFLRNDKLDLPSFASDSSDSLHAVDPTWLMLRVDYRDSTGAHRPAGAFSLFAIHGTANAEVDSLYDGDIHALLERGLERHADSVSGEQGRAVPRFFHLLANGTEGDVSPAWPEASRCPPPRLAPIGWRAGPRAGHPAPAWLEVTPARAAACIRSGREFAVDAARTLTRQVTALFDSLGGVLDRTSNPPVRVAFGVWPVQGGLAPAGLCQPAIGLSALGGAPDGRSRMADWRPLGGLLHYLEINDGPGAPRVKQESCQGWKHVPSRFGQWILGGLGLLPDFAEFTVARVGDVVLATGPVEFTTVAGERVRREVRRHLGRDSVGVMMVGVVGLTNGYLSYVTTEAEYARQRYEAASTMLGPKTDSVFASLLGGLAARLARGDSTVHVVPPLRVSPGPREHIMPVRQQDAPPAAVRVAPKVRCHDGVVEVEWLDRPPEWVLPHDGPLVRIDAQVDTGWAPLTWDDDPWVEVVPSHPVRGGYLWRLRWLPHPPPAGPLRVVLEPREGETGPPPTAPLPPGCFPAPPGR